MHALCTPLRSGSNSAAQRVPQRRAGLCPSRMALAPQARRPSTHQAPTTRHATSAPPAAPAPATQLQAAMPAPAAAASQHQARPQMSALRGGVEPLGPLLQAAAQLTLTQVRQAPSAGSSPRQPALQVDRRRRGWAPALTASSSWQHQQGRQPAVRASACGACLPACQPAAPPVPAHACPAAASAAAPPVG